MCFANKTIIPPSIHPSLFADDDEEKEEDDDDGDDDE